MGVPPTPRRHPNCGTSPLLDCGGRGPLGVRWVSAPEPTGAADAALAPRNPWARTGSARTSKPPRMAVPSHERRTRPEGPTGRSPSASTSPRMSPSDEAQRADRSPSASTSPRPSSPDEAHPTDIAHPRQRARGRRRRTRPNGPTGRSPSAPTSPRMSSPDEAQRADRT
jgi:hypothetical protein